MTKTINAIVEGGKATPGPPLGPALGPLGINAAQVVAEINKQTASFSGMKVPVAVNVDPKAKTFTVSVGSPPTAELLKKEAGIQKGSGTKDAKAGDISLEKLIKVAKQKSSTSLGKTLKDIAKEVLGTCVSMGLTVNGKDAKLIMGEVDKGAHDSLLAG